MTSVARDSGRRAGSSRGLSEEFPSRRHLLDEPYFDSFLDGPVLDDPGVDPFAEALSVRHILAIRPLSLAAPALPIMAIDRRVRRRVI